MDEVLKILIKNFYSDVNYFFVSDYSFNRKKYREMFGKDPDFNDPKTFTEKLLYLKMYYYNPLQNLCADKYTVMDYVRICGYPEILKKVYQVCYTVDEIDESFFPDEYFIQCSHTQSHNYVMKKNDKDKLDRIKREYKALLQRKHYKFLRENCYKNVIPRIICSEYLKEPGRDTLTDYKFYCFSGKARYFMVSYGEFEHNVKNHKFDMEWNSIDCYFKEKPAVNPDLIPRPKNFDKMVEIVNRLAAPFPHVRIDLYNLDGRIVFGEMTFYSAGGFVKVASDEMNLKIGSWIDLNKYNNDMMDRTKLVWSK